MLTIHRRNWGVYVKTDLHSPAKNCAYLLSSNHHDYASHYCQGNHHIAELHTHCGLCCSDCINPQEIKEQTRSLPETQINPLANAYLVRDNIALHCSQVIWKRRKAAVFRYAHSLWRWQEWERDDFTNTMFFLMSGPSLLTTTFQDQQSQGALHPY